MKKKRRPSAPPSLPRGCELIDSHCHLDMDAYGDELDAVIARARDAGVGRIVTIGIDTASSGQAVRLAESHPGIYATVGIHPHDAARAGESDFSELAALASHPGVVAYGEIGLDYAKLYSPPEEQRRVFARQLGLARELDLPVIIHDRDAHGDTMHLLRKASPFARGGVMHCFSGDTGLAGQVLDLGFYISIPGIVTFKNAAELQQVVREVPMERIILETDGPFLSPVPFRGKRNEPAFLVYTAAKVAELKGLPLEEVARLTTENTETLFRLPPTVSP
ncbi:MAG TPA: TatD family deoxyribonuclease [Desulfobulbus sp.]|nr:TatD family deoxyribonuclease [Desulfobulbus sp.]